MEHSQRCCAQKNCTMQNQNLKGLQTHNPTEMRWRDVGRTKAQKVQIFGISLEQFSHQAPKAHEMEKGVVGQ